MDAVTFPGLTLAVLALFATTVWAEAMADPVPTIQVYNQEVASGSEPYDITTKNPFQELTEKSLTFEYDDLNRSLPADDDYGALGPGAITAIVIAVFLGASVLLALIVITIRKFTAS